MPNYRRRLYCARQRSPRRPGLVTGWQPRPRQTVTAGRYDGIAMPTPPQTHAVFIGSSAALQGPQLLQQRVERVGQMKRPPITAHKALHTLDQHFPACRHLSPSMSTSLRAVLRCGSVRVQIVRANCSPSGRGCVPLNTSCAYVRVPSWPREATPYVWPQSRTLWTQRTIHGSAALLQSNVWALEQACTFA